MQIICAATMCLASPAALSCASTLSSAGHRPCLPSCLLCPQAKSRVAFGKPLIEQGTVLADIALSRVEIEQARLLVLKAAHVMDVAGNKVGGRRTSQRTGPEDTVRDASPEIY